MKSLKKPGRVKAAILDWLGVPIDLMDDDFWKFFGNTNVAGQVINEKTVMQLSAVWSCVRLIAETISTLPLQIYERTADGRKTASNHPLYDIIHTQPNVDSTATVFWEAMIVAMLMGGNGVAEPKYIGQRLIALNFLDPRRLSCSKVNGKRQWKYTLSDGTQRTLTDAQVFRVPGFTMDGDWGVSAVMYGAGVFGSALAAANASNSTFAKGMMPTVAFTLPGKLNAKDRDDFRDTIRRISGALNAGESPVLENGMTGAPLGINPVDAQLLESRNFSVEEICRWFRVPPFMVGHTAGSTNWGTGIEQQMIGFLTFTLRPWLTRIEQAINMNLLSPSDRLKFYAEFSVEGLLRADSAGRAEYLAKMTSNGLMTRDEGRSKENLPPKGGNADVLTVQSAMMPLDKLGTQPATTTTQVPPNET
jgi:HK97 family phage portal protein